VGRRDHVLLVLALQTGLRASELINLRCKDVVLESNGPLLPSIRGERLSRDALEHLVRKYCLTASRACPSLAGKRVTPHTLRHSTAMELLHHGVDQSVIALWLGHEFVETTQIYIHADMRLKEKALSQVASPETHPGRYRPSDELLAVLEAL
jgi:site-specific recombinase XerD